MIILITQFMNYARISNMIEKLMRYILKRKEVNGLCDRVRYGFMSKDCESTGKMRHLVDGTYYLIDIEREQ